MRNALRRSKRNSGNVQKTEKRCNAVTPKINKSLCRKLQGIAEPGNTCLQTPGTCESCPLYLQSAEIMILLNALQQSYENEYATPQQSKLWKQLREILLREIL